MFLEKCYIYFSLQMQKLQQATNSSLYRSKPEMKGLKMIQLIIRVIKLT